MSSSMKQPKHRAPIKGLKALSKGFDSINLSQSGHYNKMLREIEHQNTVAEAWNQTGQMLRIAMSDSSPASKR